MQEVKLSQTACTGYTLDFKVFVPKKKKKGRIYFLLHVEMLFGIGWTHYVIKINSCLKPFNMITRNTTQQ